MRKFLILLVIVLGGCGKKYPIPPEPGPGDLPPLGSYVLDKNWPGGDVEFDSVSDVIVGKDGFIYVLDRMVFRKMLITGEVVGEDTVPPGMTSVSQDDERNLYFAGEDSVIYVFTYGEWQTIALPDSLGHIGGIAVAGKIFISDTASDIVIGFLPDSSVDTVARYGNGALYVDDPLDLWVDPRNRVLTVSLNHNWVEAFPTDSVTPFLHLGGDDPAGDTLEGTFRIPVDVVSDDSGYIYVADSFRVQKFTPDGEFVTCVRFETSPVSVAITDDGKYLIVATASRLYKFERFDGLQQGGGEK